MEELVRLFFKSQGEIFIPKNPDVPSAGNYRLELLRGPDTGITESGRIGRTNLMVFTQQMILTAIPSETAPGVPAAGLSFMPPGSSHEGVVGVTRPMVTGQRSRTRIG
jgi:hypothetical protein